MSFLFRLFSKKAPEEDYEQVLASLANDIQKRQVALSEIRLRERRSTLLVTLYALAAYGAYFSMWYLQMVPNFNQRVPGLGGPNAEKFVKAVPVVVGPIAILFIRRIVQIWYKRKGDAEEKTLQGLLKNQRTKIEQIKKNTNYYSMRNLIERYDDTPIGSPIRPQSMAASQAKMQLQQGPTPIRQPQIPNGASPPTQPRSKQQSGFTPLQLSQPQPQHLPPPRKQWYDRVADALLGDDESTGPRNASSSKYALICEKCFTHNGLVKEDVWLDTQYKCPSCGHFNPPARAKRQLAQRELVSPTSPNGVQPFSPLPNPTVSKKMKKSPSHSPKNIVSEDADAMIVDSDVQKPSPGS